LRPWKRRGAFATFPSDVIFDFDGESVKRSERHGFKVARRDPTQPETEIDGALRIGSNVLESYQPFFAHGGEHTSSTDQSGTCIVTRVDAENEWLPHCIASITYAAEKHVGPELCDRDKNKRGLFLSAFAEFSLTEGSMTSNVTHPWLIASNTAVLRPAEAPSGKRIAVIAPHPDDELLGCGGTLLRTIENQPGTRIRVMYLTNGEQGTSNRSESVEDIARRRRDEARSGLAVLGISECDYAGFPDGLLAPGPLEAQRMTEFLDESSPEIVMVPAPLDPHPDHRAATAILSRCLQAKSAVQPSIWLYEVQPGFPMNALVCIDGFEGAKTNALAEHRSQDVNRLTRAALGLAACRALYAPFNWQYAEAFRITSAANFVDFCRLAGLC
jgi:LmbE family N-acetylglucosaminyl deacetylase